jgi:hypothetical protein
MNPLKINEKSSYDHLGSTLTRDASLYTSTAIPGELSKLMENEFVVLQFDQEMLSFPTPDFKFHPFSTENKLRKSFTVSTLPDSKLSLIKPINIDITYEGDEVKAELPEVELYAFSNNEIQAVNEITQDLIDLFNDLNEIPDYKLGQHPKRWKMYMKSIIKANA